MPIELPHARDRLRNVVDGALNDLQKSASLRTQALLALQERICVERHRRYRVVDVMRDPARHLSERTESLLLHHSLLRLLQVLVCALQGGMSLGLMARQRDMLAQLTQEFTFAAGEAVGLATSSDQYAKYFAFHQ